MSKKISTFASLTALAFIFSYIEAVLPFSLGIPGVKLGLANIITVITLYRYGVKQALYVSLLRIVLVGFTFGSPYTMLYGLAGGIFSYMAMSIAKKSNAFHIIGVSVLGGTFHNIGQLFVAVLVTNTLRIAYYIPVLIVSGVVTGFVIGLFSSACLKRLTLL